MSDQHKTERPTVPTAEYLGTSAQIVVPQERGGRYKPEVHVTFRLTSGSFAPTTRALTLEQAVRLRADLDDAIVALRENGFSTPKIER